MGTVIQGLRETSEFGILMLNLMMSIVLLKLVSKVVLTMIMRTSKLDGRLAPTLV